MEIKWIERMDKLEEENQELRRINEDLYKRLGEKTYLPEKEAYYPTNKIKADFNRNEPPACFANTVPRAVEAERILNQQGVECHIDEIIGPNRVTFALGSVAHFEDQLESWSPRSYRTQYRKPHQNHQHSGQEDLDHNAPAQGEELSHNEDT